MYLKNCLRELNTHGRHSVIFGKGDTFLWLSVGYSAHQAPSKNGLLQKERMFNNFFPLWRDFLEEEHNHFDSATAPKHVTIFIKIRTTRDINQT